MKKETKKNILRAAAVLALLGILYMVSQKVMSPPVAVYDGNNIPGVAPGTPGIPPIDPESVSRVVTDPKTRQEYMSNQVIIEFASGVSEQESVSIIESVGGTMLQRFTNAPIFLIQVKDKGDGVGAASVVTKLNKDPKVKKADLNYLTTLDEKPQ